MGSWGSWSSCSAPCGVGSTERSRQVSVPPRNGGRPCPDLKQRRGCLGNNAVCSTAKGQSPGWSGSQGGWCPPSPPHPRYQQTSIVFHFKQTSVLNPYLFAVAQLWTSNVFFMLIQIIGHKTAERSPRSSRKEKWKTREWSKWVMELCLFPFTDTKKTELTFAV